MSRPGPHTADTADTAGLADAVAPAGPVVLSGPANTPETVEPPDAPGAPETPDTPGAPEVAETDSSQEFHFLGSLPEGPERRQVLARLIDAWQPTARRLARRYVGPSTGRDEVRSAADAGLVKAVDRYVPERDGAFEAFADDVIRAELRQRFQDDDRINDVLRQVGKVRDVVRGTLQELEGGTGPGASVTARIATRAGLDEDDVVLGLEVLDSQVSLGLDAALTPDAGAPAAPATAPDGDGAALSEHELRVLHMRYFRRMPADEIAGELDLSPGAVARTLARASRAIRALAAGADAPETEGGPAAPGTAAAPDAPSSASGA